MLPSSSHTNGMPKTELWHHKLQDSKRNGDPQPFGHPIAPQGDKAALSVDADADASTYFDVDAELSSMLSLDADVDADASTYFDMDAEVSTVLGLDAYADSGASSKINADADASTYYDVDGEASCMLHLHDEASTTIDMNVHTSS